MSRPSLTSKQGDGGYSLELPHRSGLLGEGKAGGQKEPTAQSWLHPALRVRDTEVGTPMEVGSDTDSSLILLSPS